jgi:hypothetical protein
VLVTEAEMAALERARLYGLWQIAGAIQIELRHFLLARPYSSDRARSDSLLEIAHETMTGQLRDMQRNEVRFALSRPLCLIE